MSIKSGRRRASYATDVTGAGSLCVAPGGDC
jgi:hypothetical protein